MENRELSLELGAPELFVAYQKAAELSAEIESNDVWDIDSAIEKNELDEMGRSLGELVLGRKIEASLIDGDKTPFSQCFRLNELSIVKDSVPGIRVIEGYPGRYVPVAGYEMSIVGKIWDTRVYPLTGTIRSKVIGVDLPNGSLVVRDRGYSGVFNRTWIRMLDPETSEPAINLRFLGKN